MPSKSKQALRSAGGYGKPIPGMNRVGTSPSYQQFRVKFFHKIGISPGHKSRSITVQERSGRDLRDLPRLREPLRYDRDEERPREERRGPRRSASSGTRCEGEEASNKSVNFRETVDVVPIPMKHEYSRRIRARLWADSVEICENAERNLVEFAAEDRDWRCAFEEERMYLCGVSGDLIHPIHVETGGHAPMPAVGQEA